jgi:PAS domain-containing protein
VVEFGARAGARRQPPHRPARPRSAGGVRQGRILRSRSGLPLDGAERAGIPDELVTSGSTDEGTMKHEPLRASDGTLLHWVGVNLDIEELKCAEQALQQSQFYLREGQRLAHMGSWALNLSGFFDHWSHELFQIYALDPQRAAPTLEQYLATVHPLDRDFMAETIRTMHAQRCGCDVKKRIVRPEGELRYIRCVGIPVIEDEVLKGFLGTAMDPSRNC